MFLALYLVTCQGTQDDQDKGLPSGSSQPRRRREWERSGLRAGKCQEGLLAVR